MLELVNRERAAAGLAPLAADPELTEVARRHSVDMFARGYFSHHTPEGKDPFDRIRAADVRFRTAGENLALAPTLPDAHTGLMNSPGHRANILRPQFGRVGIGGSRRRPARTDDHAELQKLKLAPVSAKIARGDFRRPARRPCARLTFKESGDEPRFVNDSPDAV
jgi:hypothetical protein